MLSTLAIRKSLPKALNSVRLISVTPSRPSAITPSTDGQFPELKFKHQDIYPSSANLPLTLDEKVANWKRANETFFGPERDTKNFPLPVMPDKVPETYQFGFIPTRWFKNLYPRLGVSGGYTLTLGSILFLINKEWFIMTYEFVEFLAVLALFQFVRFRYGQRVRNFLQKARKSRMDMLYYSPLEAATSGYKTEIANIKTEVDRQDAIPAIFEAKKEQVDLQLEGVYRQRLAEVYATVRNRLEYQADMEYTTRSFEQTHMVNWIVDSVKKGITPQQEKESIASCIRTLKNLSATAII